MQLLTGIVSLCISSLIVTNRAVPLHQSGDASRNETHLVENSDEEGLVDFEDEEEGSDSLLDLVNEKGVESLMHLHEKGGEVLVPCFGMWWPIGGGGYGGPVYEYVEDYGDYKKRRRSRKKKKAAKMKRKKS